MPDIHYLECSFNKANGSGTVNAIAHVPNDKAKNQFPGNVTSVFNDLNQTEIDGLAAGTLIEKHIFLKTNITKGWPTIDAELRAMWQPTADTVQVEYDRNFQAYGRTLSKA